VNTEIKLILNVFLHSLFLLTCVSLLINSGLISFDEINELIKLTFEPN